MRNVLILFAMAPLLLAGCASTRGLGAPTATVNLAPWRPRTDVPVKVAFPARRSILSKADGGPRLPRF